MAMSGDPARLAGVTAVPSLPTVRVCTFAPSQPPISTGFPAAAAPAAAAPCTASRPLVSVSRCCLLVPSQPATETGLPPGGEPTADTPPTFRNPIEEFQTFER